MSVLCNLSEVKTHHRVEVTCDQCGEHLTRTKRLVMVNRGKHGMDTCMSCAAKLSISRKPQCSPEYWSTERRDHHGTVMQKSENYQNSKPRIGRPGASNHMFGRKHTSETVAKMSASRIGKIGPDATAWKGGKQSLIKRVKKLIGGREKWFGRIIDRDKCCQHCGETKRLDAHHIKPMAMIVKELLAIYDPGNDDERLLYLAEQHEVMDPTLQNGITLCRPCHKKIHRNWGSHTPTAFIRSPKSSG